MTEADIPPLGNCPKCGAKLFRNLPKNENEWKRREMDQRGLAVWPGCGFVSRQPKMISNARFKKIAPDWAFEKSWEVVRSY